MVAGEGLLAHVVGLGEALLDVAEVLLDMRVDVTLVPIVNERSALGDGLERIQQDR